ncbi:MAG: cytoplasmic filament protein CfpA, partial [SAR324 cluster bacterium]|nr:cytoplasmic filament protein CfpA [SAR324 cluster bacterium]
MARDSMSRGPNVIHPEKPSAVGSRNSLNRDNRNEYEESKLIIDEEVDKVLNHIHAKLPPEVLEKVDIMGGVKSKLHNYFNQNFQNMYNRYMVTMEDEMAKKVRDLVDKEEYRALNRYTPREIAEILDKIGGMDKFNTGEVEKSIVNIYGHLQGHSQRVVYELENETNALL